MGQPAVFLDRDGTLIEEVGYATRPQQIRILGGVARGLARFAEAGFKRIVVTNQSGIARGLGRAHRHRSRYRPGLRTYIGPERTSGRRPTDADSWTCRGRALAGEAQDQAAAGMAHGIAVEFGAESGDGRRAGRA